MVSVTLVDYTGSGHKRPERYAAAQIIFAKSTRLEMNPNLLDEIMNWSDERMEEELRYIANTIPSSWEMCHYTFLITGATRAFTHQFVRTRTASFAQQTMRVLNVSSGPGWDYLSGPSIETEEQHEIYDDCMSYIDKTYKYLIEKGVKVEDARGVLPTNIKTNILVSMNMRTLVEMIRKRSSPRTQGEYRDVLQGIKEVSFSAHPWLRMFVERTFDKAASELDKEIQKLDVSVEVRTHMMKLVDQMRSQS